MGLARADFSPILTSMTARPHISPRLAQRLRSTRLFLVLFARLLLGLTALTVAAVSPADPPTRLLLALTGLLTTGLPLPIFVLRIRRPNGRPTTVAPLRAVKYLRPQADDALGWSYQEVRRRVFDELGVQMRGILALVSLFTIAQVGLSIFCFSASPIVLVVVEAVLCGGLVLGLHLGWRGWQVLRAEHLARI